MLIAKHSYASNLKQCIERMIAHPYAFIPPNYQSDIMPDDFGTKLSTAQLTALVDFLAADSE